MGVGHVLFRLCVLVLQRKILTWMGKIAMTFSLYSKCIVVCSTLQWLLNIEQTWLCNFSIDSWGQSQYTCISLSKHQSKVKWSDHHVIEFHSFPPAGLYYYTSPIALILLIWFLFTSSWICPCQLNVYILKASSSASHWNHLGCIQRYNFILLAWLGVLLFLICPHSWWKYTLDFHFMSNFYKGAKNENDLDGNPVLKSTQSMLRTL